MSAHVSRRLSTRQLRTAMAEYRDSMVQQVLVGDVAGARVDGTGYVLLRDEVLNPSEQAALRIARKWCNEQAANRDLEQLRAQLTRHICTADCWAYMARNGQDENTTACDPFAARAAADRELA